MKCCKTEDKRDAPSKTPSKLKGQRHEMLYRATKIEEHIENPGWALSDQATRKCCK